jgi:hypothetical protein
MREDERADRAYIDVRSRATFAVPARAPRAYPYLLLA